MTFDNDQIISSIILTVSELLIITILFFLLKLVSGLIAKRLGRVKAFDKFATQSKTIGKIVRLTLTLSYVFLLLGILIFNSYQIYQGVDLKAYTLELINKIPPNFWLDLGISIGKFIALMIAAKYFSGSAAKILDRLKVRAVEFEQLRENDESVEYFFQTLKRIITVSLWLMALFMAFKWSPLPKLLAENTLLVLKVYLIISIGLLIVSAVAAIVDSLDGLSKRYAESNGFLAFYDSLRCLIPLLRKSLEYIIYVGVATLVLQLTEFVPELAEYGPGIIQAIGLVFIARVVIEVINLLINRSFLHDKLEPEERQRNLTIFPIVQSVLAGIVYFITLIMILKGIGFDPVPLLAGAGILSMVIGLGAQPLIGDIMAGFFLILEGQFKVGDFIETSNARGVVEKITLRTTSIRNPDGQLHMLRNGEMKEIVNFSCQYTNASVYISVAPDADIDKVFGVITAAGKEFAEQEDDVLEPTQVLGVDDIDGPEIRIRTITKVKPGKHLGMGRKFRRVVLDKFEGEGIAIPFKSRYKVV